MYRRQKPGAGDNSDAAKMYSVKTQDVAIDRIMSNF